MIVTERPPTRRPLSVAAPFQGSPHPAHSTPGDRGPSGDYHCYAGITKTESQPDTHTLYCHSYRTVGPVPAVHVVIEMLALGAFATMAATSARTYLSVHT